MHVLLLLALTTSLELPQALVQMAARLASAPAWQASFVQEYVPAGFDTGSREAGTLWLVPPSRLRFDYGTSARVFAVDGAVARHLDLPARVCDAVRLNATAWARLPLASILDPAAAAQRFRFETVPAGVRFIPLEPLAEAAEIEVLADEAGYVTRLVVTDEAGNRNFFFFSRWKSVPLPPARHFQPALPGEEPCEPEAP